MGKARDKVKVLEEKLSILQTIGLRQAINLYGIKSKSDLEEEIKKLQKQIKQSKQGIKAREVGNSFENDVAKTFKKVFGLDFKRTPRSGGFAKTSKNRTLRGDISLIDDSWECLIHVECKNQETWKLREWLKQAEEDRPENKFPIIVFHRRKEIENNKVTETAENYVAMKLEDFLRLVDTEVAFIQKG
jgi:hypothetical protein